ncbi:MAG: hypothetical protein J5J00_05950 [Deltaproteobacteria bacterium]|nr:hypothetical protein [Deltaproteobacteria bacterium]
MSKKHDPEKCSDHSSACEIIELAINDINLLSRAFSLIKDICEDPDGESSETSGIPDTHLH